MPSHREDPVQRRVARLDARPQLERVPGGMGLQGLEDEWLRGRLDVDLQIAPGAPPERVEDAVATAVGQHLVRVAEHPLVRDHVAVALAEAVADQGLLIAEAHARPVAAGEGELGIGRDQLASVEEEGGLRVGRDA